MLKLAGETLNGMLAEHLDQPDAHMADIFQTLRTGGYYGIPYSSYDSEAAMAANTLYAVPFLVARSSTWDRIAIEVTTAAAGKSARLGIYKNGDNLYPGSLVENTEGEEPGDIIPDQADGYGLSGRNQAILCLSGR